MRDSKPFTKNAAKLISLLREGWEIHQTSISSPQISLSLCKGNEIKRSGLWATFNSLVVTGIIEPIGCHGWTTVYSLTEKGRTI